MVANTFMKQNESALFVKVTYHQKLWVAIAYLKGCFRAVYHLLLTTLGNRFYPAQILGIVFQFQKIVIRTFQLSSPTKRNENFVLGYRYRSFGYHYRWFRYHYRRFGYRYRLLRYHYRWFGYDYRRLRYHYLSLFYLHQRP